MQNVHSEWIIMIILFFVFFICLCFPKTVTIPHGGKEKGRRLYQKADYCKFCKKMYTSKISAHYQNCHQNESGVIEITSLPKGSRERKRKALLLQNEGNHIHNTQVKIIYIFDLFIATLSFFFSSGAEFRTSKYKLNICLYFLFLFNFFPNVSFFFVTLTYALFTLKV